MRTVSLRSALAMMLLPLLGLVIAFQYGVLDHYVRYRAQWLCQAEPDEWRCKYLGVDIWQYPGDMMLYQELISRTKPDVIIEAGTLKGGNAIYLASILEFVNPKGKVITIDIEGNPWRETVKTWSAEGKDRLLARIEFVEGSSTSPETFEAVAKLVPGGCRVLVILDSMHTREHVLEELRLYSKLVSPDSWIIVNDTQWGNEFLTGYRYGAEAAVEDFLKENPSFARDRIDRFMVSCCHTGFLKRVK